jgi:hypothetical protein
MNAPARIRAPHSPAAARSSSLEIFVTRCKARAAQWAAGELDLHDAVDNCQQAAEAYGLVIELGQDAVQAIMVEAFAPVRDDLPRDEGVVPDPIDEHEEPDVTSSPLKSADDDYDGLPRTFAKLCREADERQARKAVNTARAPRVLDDVAPATLRAANFLIRQKDPARLRAWFAKHTAAERAAILRYLEQKARRK